MNGASVMLIELMAIPNGGKYMSAYTLVVLYWYYASVLWYISVMFLVGPLVHVAVSRSLIKGCTPNGL